MSKLSESFIKEFPAVSADLKFPAITWGDGGVGFPDLGMGSKLQYNKVQK